MLNFQTQMKRDYHFAKQELERMPYIKIAYPMTVNAENWEYTVSDDILPKVDGSLYFIYDSKKTLLYIGKSQKIDFALRNHLLRKTSKSTCSILEPLKQSVSKSKSKCIYIKTLTFEPSEYGAYLKPLFIREYQPLWVRRMN